MSADACPRVSELPDLMAEDAEISTAGRKSALRVFVQSLLAGLAGFIFFPFGLGWTLWSWLWALVWASANRYSRRKQELQYETNFLLWEAQRNDADNRKDNL